MRVCTRIAKSNKDSDVCAPPLSHMTCTAYAIALGERRRCRRTQVPAGGLMRLTRLDSFYTTAQHPIPQVIPDSPAPPPPKKKKKKHKGLASKWANRLRQCVQHRCRPLSRNGGVVGDHVRHMWAFVRGYRAAPNLQKRRRPQSNFYLADF